MLLSIIAKFVLFMFGWITPTKQQFHQFNKHPRSIIVFSHTSYADFFILIIYLLAFPKQLKNVRVLIKPDPFEYKIGDYILRKLGGIPGTKVTEKNGGATNKIIEELNKQEKFNFLISPKGTIVKHDWKNGYYFIAKELKARLLTAGLDYEKKSVVVTEGINYDEDKDKIEQVLKEQLSSIVPLFPKDEIYTIRPYDANKISIIKHDRLIMIGIIILLLILCYIL